MRTPRLFLGIFALALLLPLLLLACGGSDEPTDGTSSERATDEPSASPRSETATALATEEVESAPPPGSVAEDREILIAVYNALDGPNWEDSGNWLSDTPLGEWSGVTTDDNGRVIWLQIGGSGSGQELNGEIPLELIGLGALEILGLSGGFHGVDLRGEIPPELGNLSNLTNLSIEGNGFTGEIPPELGSLSNLTELWLNGNALSGEIPPELGNLANLTDLDLTGMVDLRGCVPSSLEDQVGSSSLGEMSFC